MKQDTRNLAGLLACVALLATLLGGCPASPVYAQPPGPEPTTCEECRTDEECERLCGGEYQTCLGLTPVCGYGMVPLCICPSSGMVCSWSCVSVGS